MAGAAIATVLAQLLSTIGCFIYAFAHIRCCACTGRTGASRGWIWRHLIQGIPLGLQFSVLAVGIIVMQSVVVQFDMLDGLMVSSAAQNGFGAANKLFSLVATPMNALGDAMTSFTAQNLGAGSTTASARARCRRWCMVVHLRDSRGAHGSAADMDGDYLHHVPQRRQGDAGDDPLRQLACCMWTSAMYLSSGLCLCRAQLRAGHRARRFVLGAGAAELVARITVCLLLPAAVCRRHRQRRCTGHGLLRPLRRRPHGVDRGGSWCCASPSSATSSRGLPVFAAQPSVTAALSHPRHSVPGIFSF